MREQGASRELQMHNPQQQQPHVLARFIVYFPVRWLHSQNVKGVKTCYRRSLSRHSESVPTVIFYKGPQRLSLSAL